MFVTLIPHKSQWFTKFLCGYSVPVSTVEHLTMSIAVRIGRDCCTKTVIQKGMWKKFQIEMCVHVSKNAMLRKRVKRYHTCWNHYCGLCPNQVVAVLTETCGFPLAEQRKKRKTFFSHTWLGVWVQVCGGFRSRGLCKVSVFVLPSVIAWRAPPTHPWRTCRMCLVELCVSL